MTIQLPGLPSSRCHPPQGGHCFASLHTCHGLGSTPTEPRTLAFSLPGSCLSVLDSPYCYWISFRLSTITGLYQPSDGCEPSCGLCASLCTLPPCRFPILRQASHPALGFSLVTRCLPRSSNELADMSATLGSFYWLSFETSGLSPDKKRLAWLGAQQYSYVTVLLQGRNGQSKFSLKGNR
jgi:hypothetical protein